MVVYLKYHYYLHSGIAVWVSRLVQVETVESVPVFKLENVIPAKKKWKGADSGFILTTSTQQLIKNIKVYKYITLKFILR